jgi:molybdate transport system substrate-binding protein
VAVHKGGRLLKVGFGHLEHSLKPNRARFERKRDFALACAASPVTIAPMPLNRRTFLALGAAFAALPAALPASGSTGPVVFAAASLKPALDQIASDITPMRLSYGGSGALARQITQGAPADLFLSANPAWMDVVTPRIIAGTRHDLLGNALVLVGHASAPPIQITQWPPATRIALGFIEAVPAGQYAREAFTTLGLWDAVQPHIVEVENVRAALALVTRGELPYAVTYASDAQAEPSVKTLHRFAPGTHSPIRYPLALLSETARPTYDALLSPQAAAIFTEAGFKVL